jgi:predicted histone-like DNA-binding protein
MAFYKKKRQRLSGKWHPFAVIVGKPVTTDHVADRLAAISTVSRGDTYAVLKDLGGVLGDYMAEGRSVRLEGLGTFRYTAVTTGKGVDTPDEVSAKQITDVRVRFVPEVGKNTSGKITTRSLVSDEIFWVEFTADAVVDPTVPDTQPADPPNGGTYIDPNARKTGD